METKEKKKGKLRPKHKAFADHYLRDPGRNPRKAYQKVYPKVKDRAADANASKLLTNANIREYIAEIEKKNTEKTEITVERIIKEYARIAFLDVRKLFNKGGKLKKITDLDDDTAAAIAGMDISTFTKDDDEVFITEIVKKIKNVDKKGALDSLARIKGMFNDTVTHKLTIEDLIDDD